ncbi:MAG: CehA/McbA family metallohydrolase [Bacteroidales bacterium]
MLAILFSILQSPTNQCLGQAEKALLHVTILDKETQQPTPVRVHVTKEDGSTAGLPPEAISVMYGRNDRPEGYGYQPDSSCYVDGEFSLALEPGDYFLTLSKGVEYLDQVHQIQMEEVGLRLVFTMERWIHMADSGWYSGDEHIHIRRSPRENPHILKWIEAEDIHVGALLQMGDFRNIYFGQFAFGDEGVYSEQDRVLSPGQEEPRTHQVGHTISLMADEFVRYQNDYYYYDKLLDRIHELNGITGYAHQGESFQGYRGMTMDILDNKVDFLEILQFCVDGGPLLVRHYYHFLDLGYKITATAGSDFPWCGIGPRFGVDGPDWNARIGNVRFYTHLGKEFSYDLWKQELKAGHTFVSSGPMIDFKVNGHLPGDQVDLQKPSTLSIKAQGYGHEGQVPLSRLEIIAHGKVIASATPGDASQSADHLSIQMDLPVDQGIWIAARCYAGPNQAAHTTPIYVTINGSGFLNPETCDSYLELNEKYLDELEAELDTPHENLEYRAYWYRKGLKSRIATTRQVIEKLRNKQ